MKTLNKPLTKTQERALFPLVQINRDLKTLAVEQHKVLHAARPLFEHEANLFRAACLVAGHSEVYWRARFKRSPEQLRQKRGLTSGNLDVCTTIQVAKSVMRRFRRYCRIHNITLKAAVTDLIEGFLETEGY